MWVTRQRVERGRVAGACNRKILSAGKGVLHSSRSGVAVKTSSSVPPTLRFGVFELDPRAGELRKKGMKIRLQGQPVQILVMLLECPGEVVTREELQKKLWKADTFVDFEQGLNNAMKRLRAALADDAESPHFIETLPRRGYRFIGAGNGEPPQELASDKTILPPFEFADSIAVLPFENSGRDPDMEYLSDGITETLINNLSRLERLRVVPRTTVFRYKGKMSDPARVGRELRARLVLTAQVIQRGEQLISG